MFFLWFYTVECEEYDARRNFKDGWITYWLLPYNISCRRKGANAQFCFFLDVWNFKIYAQMGCTLFYVVIVFDLKIIILALLQSPTSNGIHKLTFRVHVRFTSAVTNLHFFRNAFIKQYALLFASMRLKITFCIIIFQGQRNYWIQSSTTYTEYDNILSKHIQ